MTYNGRMIFRNFYVLLFFLLGSHFAPAYAEPMVSLKQPPASLAQWYKPANKRQVWLHTMFRLRREMQAIREYAGVNDKAAMKKWAQRLDKDYNKIADMVPEWEKLSKPRLLSELEMFIEKGDMPRVGKTLEMITRTCDDCHSYFQPLVTATYRAPYYADIKLEATDGGMQSLEDNMQALSESVNRILIALDDGHKSVALQSGKNLAARLQNLAGSCERCHKDDEYPRQRILGEAMKQRLDKLQANIGAGQIKESQKLMGEIAVSVCARCHNIHRIVSDLRNALLPE
jgi:cytochrome c553